MAINVSMSELAAECGVSRDRVESELDTLAREEHGDGCWQVPGMSAHYVAVESDRETYLRLSAALKLARRLMRFPGDIAWDRVGEPAGFAPPIPADYGRSLCEKGVCDCDDE